MSNEREDIKRGGILGTGMLGRRVLVRTERAGVHFGNMIGRDGQEVLLGGGRRLWSWSGALSLSEVAKVGVDIKSSKISVAVEEILLMQAIEIIPISNESTLNELWS